MTCLKCEHYKQTITMLEWAIKQGGLPPLPPYPEPPAEPEFLQFMDPAEAEKIKAVAAEIMKKDFDEMMKKA
jgi:hypothetical protein